MSGIYSAKFMNEASCTLANKVIKRPVAETYLFSSMNILREMNNLINNKTKQLYINISEAESKEDENKLFANYFYEFKNIFETFADKINQMKSRMTINIENKVETWNDLIEDDSYIENFDTQFSYSGWDFSHMTDCNYPRFNLYRAYQKEFDSIGLLMQDKSIDATPTTKMKIIASVMNNFSKYSNDNNWIRDIIKDMIDSPDSSTDSYSQNIYYSLRSKRGIKVDKSIAYIYKNNLCDYENIIDTCNKMCDNLIIDLKKITEDISSYMFRNQDKKLKIKTETDGVIDRDYRLDTYSMNELNLFIKNKCNQMKKILNIYSIAIGIKFDTAIDYIDQCIYILKSVKGYDDDKNLTDDCTSDDTSSSDDNSGHIDDIDEPMNDTNISDNNNQSDNDDASENSDSEYSDDFDYDDDFYEDEFYNQDQDDEHDEDDDEDDSKKDESNPVVVGKNTDEFEESYLFESEIFELEMLSEMQTMHEEVMYVLEDKKNNNTGSSSNQSSQGNSGDNNTQNNNSNDNSSMSNIKALANKAKEPNIIMQLINKLKELWKKFKEYVTIGSKSKIEYLKNNAKYINVKITGKVGLSYTPNFNFINSIKIPDLNYEAMKDSLESNEKFYEKFDFYKNDNDGKTISEYIKDKALGEPQEATENLEKIVPSIKTAYDFCVNYPSKVQALDRQMQTLDKAEKVIMEELNKAKVNNESATFDDYFHEIDTSQDTSTADKKSALNVYFRVCSQVVSAEMTVYQKLFNELYLYCKWHIMKAGGSADKATKEGDNKNQNNNSEQNNGQNNNSNEQNKK